MKKLIILSAFFSLPAFASTPILNTDFLDKGEQMVTGGFNHYKIEMEGDIAPDDINFDGSGAQTELSLKYAYGFTKKQLLILDIPYTFLGKRESDFTFTDGTKVKFKSEGEGLGDLSAEYRFLLKDAGSQRIAVMLGADIPVGDDDSGESEIIENGVKTQSMKKGGVGSGRSDFRAATSMSSGTGNTTFFASALYELIGTKTDEGEEIEPGDEIFLEAGLLQKIDAKSNLGALVGYNYTLEGKRADVDISSTSSYAASVAYFYHVTNSFMLSPQVAYIATPEQKETDRTDGSVMTFSKFNAFSFTVEFSKTF